MDLIDRDNLKEAIKMAITVPVDCSYDLGYNDMVLNAVKIVDSMPAVDAQPVKRGKWETKGGVHCTRCGWRPTGRICDLFTAYCAGCGAKMDGDAK